jgi:hypothetical protein
MVALLLGLPLLLFVCRRIEEAHERASRAGYPGEQRAGHLGEQRAGPE